MPTQQILLKRDAASILKISLNTLNRLINDGKIKQVQLSSRRVGIASADIDLFIQNARGVNNGN